MCTQPSPANSMNDLMVQTKAFARSINNHQANCHKDFVSHHKAPTPSHSHLARTTAEFLVTRSTALVTSCISSRTSRGVIATSSPRNCEFSKVSSVSFYSNPCTPAASMNTISVSMPATKSVSTTRPIAAVGATVRRSWNPQPTITIQSPLTNGYASESCQATPSFSSTPSTSFNNFYSDTQTMVFSNQENARNFINTGGLQCAFHLDIP